MINLEARNKVSNIIGEMSKKIDACQKQVTLIQNNNSYQDYRDLEFNIFYLLNDKAELDYLYSMYSSSYMFYFDDLLLKERENHKSDTMAKKAVESQMEEEVNTYNETTRMVEKIEKYVKNLGKIASSINSSFIKEMADQKRKDALMGMESAREGL